MSWSLSVSQIYFRPFSHFLRETFWSFNQLRKFTLLVKSILLKIELVMVESAILFKRNNCHFLSRFFSSWLLRHSVRTAELCTKNGCQRMALPLDPSSRYLPSTLFIYTTNWKKPRTGLFFSSSFSFLPIVYWSWQRLMYPSASFMLAGLQATPFPHFFFSRISYSDSLAPRDFFGNRYEVLQSGRNSSLLSLVITICWRKWELLFDCSFITFFLERIAKQNMVFYKKRNSAQDRKQ